MMLFLNTISVQLIMRFSCSKPEPTFLRYPGIFRNFKGEDLSTVQTLAHNRLRRDIGVCFGVLFKEFGHLLVVVVRPALKTLKQNEEKYFNHR